MPCDNPLLQLTIAALTGLLANTDRSGPYSNQQIAKDAVEIALITHKQLLASDPAAGYQHAWNMSLQRAGLPVPR